MLEKFTLLVLLRITRIQCNFIHTSWQFWSEITEPSHIWPNINTLPSGHAEMRESHAFFTHHALLRFQVFNAFFCVQDKHKNFLHEVARSWISEVQNRSESNSDEIQLPEKQTPPRGPKQDPPGRLSGGFRIHKLEKIVNGGEGKRKYPARPCNVRAAHKQSETRYTCKFCLVPLHKLSCFEKYHSVTRY